MNAPKIVGFGPLGYDGEHIRIENATPSLHEYEAGPEGCDGYGCQLFELATIGTVEGLEAKIRDLAGFKPEEQSR